MDALFGEVDAVQAGEQDLGTKAYEMDAYAAAKAQQSAVPKKTEVRNVDGVGIPSLGLW
jgi:hypothetical protein